MVDTDLEQVFAIHAGAVRAVLRGLLSRPEDAEDCWQATVLTALEHLRGIPPVAHRAWLIRVARNKALEAIRRGAVARQALRFLADGCPASLRDDPLKLAEDEEWKAALIAAIGELPESQRQVVQLKMFESLTFQEIAQRLQIPLGTALTRMRSALEKLALKLSRFE